AFDAQFLQGQVLRGTERRDHCKQTEKAFIPTVINGQERWSGAGEIGRSPTARHAGVIQEVITKGGHLAVRGTYGCYFAMYTLNKASGYIFPICNEGPQSVGLKDEPDRIRAFRQNEVGKQIEETPGAAVHHQYVPITIHDERRVWFLLDQ